MFLLPVMLFRNFFLKISKSIHSNVIDLVGFIAHLGTSSYETIIVSYLKSCTYFRTAFSLGEDSHLSEPHTYILKTKFLSKNHIVHNNFRSYI